MGLGIEKDKLRMVAVLLTGTFVAVLNATLLTPALPTIMADLGVTSTTVQWLTSGYALTEAVVIPLAAYLMGRFPSRKLFMGGMTLFAAGSLVAAISPAFPVLLLGRVMQACATGFVMPMVFSVILLVIPRERRGAAMGVIGLIIGFAPAIGPSLSGVLVDCIGWRAIFVIVTCIAVLIVLAAARFLKSYGDFKRTKFDVLSVVLSTVGLVCLLYGLSSVSSSANVAINVVLIVVGLVLVGLYAHRQMHLEQPMLRVGILATGKYRTAVIIVALFQAALMGMETIMPLYIQGVLGQSATVSGVTLLPGALIGAVTGMFAGRLFDKFGVRVPVCVGAVIIVCGLAGFTQLHYDSAIPFVMVVYAVLAVGMQFTMTPVNTWGVNSLANDAIQHAQSTSNTINQVAGSFGVALLVSIASAVSAGRTDLAGVEQTFAGYHMSFCTTACLAACAVILILVFVRDKKKAAASASGTAAAAAQGSHFQPEAAGKAGAHEPSPAFMRVADSTLSGFSLADVMNHEAATLRDTATMRDVIAIMDATNTAGVSIVDANGKLVGYVTDGDVMRYLSRSDFAVSSPSAGVSISVKDDKEMADRLASLSDLNVMELATKRVISVDVETPLDVACGVLAGRKIKKVPVTRDGVLVGAISRRNILHAMMENINKR